MNSEMMLYIKSAFAQNESLSHSKRMVTSVRMKMEQGTFYCGSVPYGYKLNGKELEIVPEEAEKIRTIFNLYLSGVGATAIVKYMQRHETGAMVWGLGRVTYILANERYMGDYMMRKRLLFMGAVGIYNEIPTELDDEDNVRNNPEQIPNLEAVEIIENSDLNYTILRPGYLQDGDEDDYTLTYKGDKAKGFESTISSVIKIAVELIADDTLYSRQSVSITKNQQ